MTMSEKWARVQAAVEGLPVDRPPYTFWLHFPEVDRDPEALARATVDLYRRYDHDLIKVMFRSSFGLEDWGCTFEHYDPVSGSWQAATYAVQAPDNWQRLETLSPDHGALGEQLRVLRIVRDSVGEEAPILATLFAPSMLASRLAGRERFLEHLRRVPDAVHAGLRAISRTVEDFGRACLEAGADGLFYAIDVASRRIMTDEEYGALGRGYDRPTLESLHVASRLTMLHMHGEELMFEELASYPAHVLNWYDRQSGPSLSEARARVQTCLAGGIDHERTLLDGTPEEIGAEVRDAAAQVAGRGLLLAPGCGLPITILEASLRALAEAARAL